MFIGTENKTLLENNPIKTNIMTGTLAPVSYGRDGMSAHRGKTIRTSYDVISYEA